MHSQVMRSLQNLNSTLRTLEAATDERFLGFPSQMNKISEKLDNANSSLEVIQTSSTDSASSLVASLERRVLEHEDHLRRLDADVEEDASAILANQNRDRFSKEISG